MKKCTTCKQEKDLSDFGKHKITKDGYKHVCKDCTKKNNERYSNLEGAKEIKTERNRLAKEKVKQAYYEYMKDKKCMLCEENHIACLDFDHRDQTTKSHNVSSMLTDRRSWSSVLKEINKCDILCANCHRKRTAIQCGWYKTRV